MAVAVTLHPHDAPTPLAARRYPVAMSIGRLVRRALGSYEQKAADRYRAFFLDTDALADTLASSVRDRDAPLRVLELGCGEGLVATSLLHRLPQATMLGVDIADDPGRNFTGDRTRATFRSCTVGQLVADDTPAFDLVVVSDVLHHIPDADLRGVVSDVVSLLAPGGLLAIKEWERDGSLAFRSGWFSDRVVSGQEVRFFDGAELRRLVADLAPHAAVVAEHRIAPRRCNLLLVWQAPVSSSSAGPAATADATPTPWTLTPSETPR